jgi:site-specific DNA-methyltransferase (adenine-specific)
MTITLYHGDCLVEMDKIEDNSVDAIIADLPYGTTACKWDTVIPFEPLWAQYKRINKPRGAIVLFGSQPFTSALVMSNPEWFRCEWIWKKSNGGGFLNANRYPLKRHENILVFSSELPPYNPQFVFGEPYRRTRAAAGETTQDQTVAGWTTDSDGRRYPITILSIPNETGLHPTQKPVALLEYLVKTYTNEGDTVLDNVMGSGTTAVACIRTGRHFIGIERLPLPGPITKDNPDYFGIASRRIERELATPYQMAFVGQIGT